MVKELTAQNFEAALKENKTAVVEFYSKTCRHCKKLEAGIQELSEELAGFMMKEVLDVHGEHYADDVELDLP